MVQRKGSRIQTARATFVIDPESKIRAIIYYPVPNGRNIQEIKRIINAMQKSDAEDVSTPANWQPGDDVVIHPPRSMQEVKERLEKAWGWNLLY